MKRASILLKITRYLSWYCLLFFYCQLASSAPEKLTFYVGVPQSPPVIYKDELTGDFTGIVPDILNSLPNEHKVKIDYIQHNRTRGEDALYNHEVDATILTTEWASNPEKLIFTHPIYKHRDFIYSKASQQHTRDLKSTLSGKNICTRRGYIYPRLQSFFDQGVATRINTSSEETELRMLLLERCHFAVVNEFIADWLINNNRWQNEISRFHQPLNSIDFTMAFAPNWKEFVEKLNQHIADIRQSGELEKIINRNRRNNHKERN